MPNFKIHGATVEPGLRVGRLIVLERVSPDAAVRAGKARAGTWWACRCDCGNTKMLRAGHLRRGSIHSCGCLHKDRRNEHVMTAHVSAEHYALLERAARHVSLSVSAFVRSASVMYARSVLAQDAASKASDPEGVPQSPSEK